MKAHQENTLRTSSKNTLLRIVIFETNIFNIKYLNKTDLYPEYGGAWLSGQVYVRALLARAGKQERRRYPPRNRAVHRFNSAPLHLK
jgi:hypothetical protein